MLPSQRALFDLPRDVCYLNAAGWSPLPFAVQEAGRAGVGRKGRPWELAPDFAAAQHERARTAARLINADPDDVALIPSVGYGVATAGKALGGLPPVAMEGVSRALRARGAALVLDATHAVGVLRTDVAALDPDFLVFPTYKWVLGPYGRAFLFVAKRRQGEAVPLEQTSHGRRGVAADREPYFRDLAFAPGARRFDMGERDHFISLGMAAVGMEMMAGWGAEAVAARLRTLTERMAEGVRGTPVRVADARVRAPHLLCLQFPEGMPEGLVERLAQAGGRVAARIGRLRVSPHVYNDETDADRFVEALRGLMR